MISEKLKKLTENNSAIRKMFEEGNRLAALYGRENVYDFSLGNPNFPAPKAVNETAVKILETEDSMSVHGYMANAGYPQVREKIAARLNKLYGTNYGTENIIMTVGAAGGLNVILKTLLNPGDEVLVFSPYFLEYGNYVGNYDSTLIAVPADRETFMPDPEALRAAVTPKTKALILNNPNNPTGVIYTEESLKAIGKVLEECSEKNGQPIYIISDEPYRELAFDGAEVPYIPCIYKNTIVGYSWSKSLSLPGERIGYLAVSPDAEDGKLISEAAGIANRILGFVNAPSLIQKVVAECLDEKTDIDAYDTNRKLLYNGLKDCGFECVYPSGAFYLWLKTPGDDKEFSAEAAKLNILLVPGSSFACPGYVRLAYCVAKSTIENSIPAFKKLAEKYGLKAGK